ncbi:MAG TPA: hypothetical protein DDZ76_08580 [Xanthomonadales bacterium]|nr:hypothetical protein [Xanthomonadales bacterium]
MTQASPNAWRNAILIPLAQAAAGAGTAVCAAIWQGWDAARGIGFGAAAVTLGFLVFGWRTTLRAPVVSAGRAFVRLILGSLLKWLMIAAGLVWAMSAGSQQPVHVLVGALVACLAYFLCLPWLLR